MESAVLFERRHEKLLPRRAFIRRLIKYAAFSITIILLSLIVGILGYRLTEGMTWTDAFLNAAMLMGGMGPVTQLQTENGKLFAGLYALYCGLVELIAVAVFAAPIVHRFLHRFHIEDKKDA